MSGNSGKMTNEAIAARGPRMVLARVCTSSGVPHLIIYREGFGDYDCPIKKAAFVGILARSYSLSYLLRVAKANG